MHRFAEWATDEKGIVSGLFVVAAAVGIFAMGASVLYYVAPGLEHLIRGNPWPCFAGGVLLAVEWGYWRWVEAVQRPGARKRDPNVCRKCGRPFWKDIGPAAT
jgi:hypothetical protein